MWETFSVVILTSGFISTIVIYTSKQMVKGYIETEFKNQQEEYRRQLEINGYKKQFTYEKEERLIDMLWSKINELNQKMLLIGSDHNKNELLFDEVKLKLEESAPFIRLKIYIALKAYLGDKDYSAFRREYYESKDDKISKLISTIRENLFYE